MLPKVTLFFAGIIFFVPSSLYAMETDPLLKAEEMQDVTIQVEDDDSDDIDQRVCRLCNKWLIEEHCFPKKIMEASCGDIFHRTCILHRYVHNYRYRLQCPECNEDISDDGAQLLKRRNIIDVIAGSIGLSIVGTLVAILFIYGIN